MNIKYKFMIKGFALLGIVGLLSSCGGGGGGGNSDPTGVFIDSAVSGIRATSHDRVNLTDVNGKFPYLQGAQVMFSIGDTVIGLGLGAPIMTPLSLVPGATDETDPEVTNIARFLQTLDLDQDLSNGIAIDSSVREAAVGITMDFSQSIATFEANEQANVDLLTIGLPGGSRTLVPVADAQLHLVRTLSVVVAGRYDGSYTGDSHGTFSVFVDRAGELFGWANDFFDGHLTLTGTATVNGGFVAGNVSSGASFNGIIEGNGDLSGSWILPPVEAGVFNGTRTTALSPGLDFDLIAMFAGTWIGNSNSNLGSESFTAFLDADGNFSLPAPDDQISAAITSTTSNTAVFSGLQDDGTEFNGTLTLPGTMIANFANGITGEIGTFSATLQ